MDPEKINRELYLWSSFFIVTGLTGSLIFSFGTQVDIFCGLSIISLSIMGFVSTMAKALNRSIASIDSDKNCACDLVDPQGYLP